MIHAIESQTASAPAWVGVLDAAKDWGIPPWEIVKGSNMLWYQRWLVLRTARMNANGK